MPRASTSWLTLALAAALAACSIEIMDNDPPAQGECGDGVVDPGERCDDGNTVSGDGCAALCDSDEVCGNGLLDVALGEQCDTLGVATDTCDVDCTFAVCGDGHANPAAGEVCDDGNTAGADGCRGDCRSDETCGNAWIDDHLPKNRVTDPIDCATATTQATGCAEVCDDGNLVAGDGCSANCLSTEVCGNGIVDVGEQCDDLNLVDTDGCRNNCTLP